MQRSKPGFVSEVMWYSVIGPAISLLPPRWRNVRFSHRLGRWEAVTAISAVGEAFLGVNLFLTWFKLEWPAYIAWISVYMVCDGGWRAMSARFEGSRGTLALMFFDESYRSLAREIWTRKHPEYEDLVTLDDGRADWQLKIEASREKKGWESGRLLMYRERYFRLESVMHSDSSRPFVYVLRALPAGVPSHNVIKYPPVFASLDPATNEK